MALISLLTKLILARSPLGNQNFELSYPEEFQELFSCPDRFQISIIGQIDRPQEGKQENFRSPSLIILPIHRL